MQISDSSVAPVAPVSEIQPSKAQTTRASASETAIQNNAGSPADEVLAAVYSTSAAGKNYSASVEQSGSSYIATIPYPPGGSVSGPSIEAAESNLAIRIDELA
jgi:hypothetical protein